MDLKALIAKMDHIESKQLLNEGFPTVADAKARADKEKTTGKFDKKELSTGTQYTRKSSTFDDGGKDKDQKKAEKKSKNEGIVFRSSIAQELLREFNLEEAPVTNPYQGADAAKFAAMSPADQAWLTKGGGVPDINDQYILMRAPNKGKPMAAAAAGAAAGGAATAAPAAAAPGVKVDPADLDRADQEMGAAMTANAAANAAQPAAATKPAAVDPAVAATREKFKALMDKLAKTGGVTGAAAAPAAKPPVGGKPAAAGFANTGGGAAVGNPNLTKQGVAR
jgi:hypothetical protein